MSRFDLPGEAAAEIKALRAALETVTKNEGKALAAARAYQDLATCYRLGKRPTEALHKRLDRAAETLRS